MSWVSGFASNFSKIGINELTEKPFVLPTSLSVIQNFPVCIEAIV